MTATHKSQTGTAQSDEYRKEKSRATIHAVIVSISLLPLHHEHPPRDIECTIPVMPVRDLSRSIAFYTQSFGFKLDWGGEAGSRLGSVSRDGCALMLSQRDSIAEPAWVWIGLEDESLFETWRSSGVKVLQEPRNCSWAYEMQFEDPDGNILWLGTEPRRDEPFEDEQPS